jgi:hypothetical protein
MLFEFVLSLDIVMAIWFGVGMVAGIPVGSKAEMEMSIGVAVTVTFATILVVLRLWLLATAKYSPASLSLALVIMYDALVAAVIGLLLRNHW